MGDGIIFNNDKKFAVLVDADNVSPKYIKSILEELSVYGTITYKRMYGDWTDPSKQRSWKDVALEHSFNLIQQFNYTAGKNSSDSALIIDAMDILYSKSVDGFCLVSSDSDFTKLSQRLREAGMYVIGMGEQKTPKPFRIACDVFKILEVISQEAESGGKNGKGEMKDITGRKQIIDTIHKIITDNANVGKTTDMGEIGNILSKTYSDFDVRNYGYSKLLTFLQSLGDFEIRKVKNSYKVSDKTSTPLEVIEKFVTELIETNGGHIDNLSLVNEKLKEKYSDFSIKQYGFNSFSKFISSFESFGVVGNSVRPKKKEAIVQKNK